MKYQQLFDNHRMMYCLAKELMQQLPDEYTQDKKALVFFTLNLLGDVMAQGHVCLWLEHYQQRTALESLNIDFVFPELNEWCDFLNELSFVNNNQQPYFRLVNQRLYLTRYDVYEQQLGNLLLEKSQLSYEPIKPLVLSHENSWQNIAAMNSVYKPLSLVVGGPGTGKTTTVIKILEALLHEHCEPNNSDGKHYRIALAAPTGKAATRLADSLSDKLASSSLSAELKTLVPDNAKTLHRLLSWSQTKRRFMFNQDNLLALDCLIVDEVSMIDLAMFTALLKAVPKNCRVILLGDAYQLASVQAGNVLAEICDDAALTSYSEKQAQCLQLLNSAELNGQFEINEHVALNDNISLLRKSYRFDGDKGIGLLAKSLLAQDENLLADALQQEEITWLDKELPQSLERFFNQAFAHYKHLLAADNIEQAFARVSQYQLLCANKQGTGSTEYFHQLFFERIDYEQQWHHQPLYKAMPVMMTQNHYALDLYNGDIGLVWEDETSGELCLFFEKADGSMERFLPSQLPGWVCAHAITVHKSQGSEYDNVGLSMPDVKSPLLSRSMFYTAVTRAKKTFTCLATEAQMQQALATNKPRFSGLALRLSQSLNTKENT